MARISADRTEGVTPVRSRREISIIGLLQWAFADECASIDFEDPGTLARGYGAIGNAYLMAQRGALGCRVDGGGSSAPDHDADLVAAAVAVLPEGVGGRRMAVAIAEMSRARIGPDPMVGARMRVESARWVQNRYGRHGSTEHICYQTDRSGRKPRRHDVRWCPITYSPTADQIARARRNYLLWWSALMELRITFQNHNNMSRWTVTDAMPPMEPWKNIVDE